MFIIVRIADIAFSRCPGSTLARNIRRHDSVLLNGAFFLIAAADKSRLETNGRRGGLPRAKQWARNGPISKDHRGCRIPATLLLDALSGTSYPSFPPP
jgi:hypothetical protein